MGELSERALELSDELRRLLGAVWRTLAPETEQTLQLDVLADVERELRTVIPDDVLALSIARGLPLSCIVEHSASMESFASTTHRLHAPFVAIDTWGEWPATSVGFVRTQERGAAQLQVWDWKTWTRWSDHPIHTVADFVRHRLAGDDADIAAPISLAGLPAPELFRPRLVAKPAVAKRYVVHAKFGRGEVLDEREGKLRIAFADAERTLLPRFVTDA